MFMNLPINNNFGHSNPGNVKIGDEANTPK